MKTVVTSQLVPIKNMRNIVYLFSLNNMFISTINNIIAFKKMLSKSLKGKYRNYLKHEAKLIK